ncbi:MAG: hypothetical protein OXF97_04580, partial [Nitrospira sp.]|nr:hypothetical protein [Nitrospira sp.]
KRGSAEARKRGSAEARKRIFVLAGEVLRERLTFMLRDMVCSLVCFLPEWGKSQGLYATRGCEASYCLGRLF